MNIFNRHTLAAGFASAALILPGCAQAEPVSYEPEPTHSYIRATYTHMGLSRQSIEFIGLEGTFNLDTETPENSEIDVTVGIDNLVTVPGGEEFVTHLSSADFFNVEEFPEANFVLTSLEQDTDTTGTMTGDLTIHGVTQPVSFDVTLNYEGTHPMMSDFTALGVSATTQILRSDFGIDMYVPYVSDEVDLEIQLELISPIAAE